MPCFITHVTPISVFAIIGAKYHDWRFNQLANLVKFGKILSYGVYMNEYSIFIHKNGDKSHYTPIIEYSMYCFIYFSPSLALPSSYLATGFEQPEAATHGRQVAHVGRAERGCCGHPSAAAAAGGGLTRSRWVG